jgi:hypothetical protein
MLLVMDISLSLESVLGRIDSQSTPTVSLGSLSEMALLYIREMGVGLRIRLSGRVKVMERNYGELELQTRYVSPSQYDT